MYHWNETILLRKDTSNSLEEQQQKQQLKFTSKNRHLWCWKRRWKLHPYLLHWWSSQFYWKHRHQFRRLVPDVQGHRTGSSVFKFR